MTDKTYCPSCRENICSECPGHHKLTREEVYAESGKRQSITKKKDGTAVGSKNGNAGIDEDTAIFIKEKLKNNGGDVLELVRGGICSYSVGYKIKNNQTWKHVIIT